MKEKHVYQPTGHKEASWFETTRVLGSDFPTLKTNASYDPAWAYALSIVAGWAYAEGQILADKLFFYGFQECEVHEISVQNEALLIVATAYVIIDKKNGDGILAFRGTVPSDIISWLTDADSAKYEFGEGLGFVHSGFFTNTEALWADIFEVVDTAINEGRIRQLYITGHSLGAAMAVVAAAQIYKDIGEKSPYAQWQARFRGVYSFAQPWVGDATFAAVFQKRFGEYLYRYVFDDDVVPCLPPLTINADFQQFGERRSAPTCDKPWTRDPPGKDRRAVLLPALTVAASFVTRRVDELAPLSQLFPYSLDDHSPQGYIEVSRNSVPQAKVRAAPVGLQSAVVGEMKQALGKVPQAMFSALRWIPAPATLVRDLSAP